MASPTQRDASQNTKTLDELQTDASKVVYEGLKGRIESIRWIETGIVYLFGSTLLLVDLNERRPMGTKIVKLKPNRYQWCCDERNFGRSCCFFLPVNLNEETVMAMSISNLKRGHHLRSECWSICQKQVGGCKTGFLLQIIGFHEMKENQLTKKSRVNMLAHR